MIGLATITKILPASLAEYIRIAVMALVVGVLCFGLGRCEGKRTEATRNDAARAEANVEAMKVDQGARDKAADRRVEDAVTVTKHEEGLIDAIAQEPDGLPDASRVALGCARLRAAGTDTAALPACR